ncbi:MAG: hypothetical protein ABIU58_01800 [Ramlibacter sp.]
MHSAPAVTYPVGRSRAAGWLLLALWLLALVSTLLWWNQLQTPGWRISSAFVVLGASGALASAAWWRTPEGMLSWDGSAWGWSVWQSGAAGSLQVSLDLQDWLLVRWQAGAASQWLVAERTSDAVRWDDFRRAVYFRARPETLHRAPPPAAKP